MIGDFGNIMKQAQQLQENLRKTQDDLAKLEVTGESGAGMVKVTMTCRHDVKRVEITPELMNEGREMLEDLLAAAINDAVRRAEQMTNEKMSALTGGMGMPPGIKIEF
ncbi:MAG: nucleoid-associated protein, YbaB/EbfC family [Gammaproteobacteria bacterium RBG_16_51_14]|nr:MAG: nucleoid-associated protein, YbaB/EbfC family [Gammaproteobacteria bacterium RBG_16_51_14]